MEDIGTKLVEFEKYLKTNNLVPPDKAKYYSNWADKFLYGINYKVSAIDQNSVAIFINSMKNNQKYADWQIRQAEDAVRMYMTNFLKLNTRPRVPEKAADKIMGRLSWEEAILKFKDCQRARHYSCSTEKTYLGWIGRFRKFSGKESADAVLDEDVRNFLTYLAVKQHVAASTQNQAFNAILLFYRHVLAREMGGMKDNLRAKRPLKLPVVLSVAEVAGIISNLEGTPALMVKLMYGCGLRLNECMRLRMDSMDFVRGLVHVRAAKGDKDRMVPMPVSLKEELKEHV